VIDNITWILGSRIQAVNATLHTLVKEREETVDGTHLAEHSITPHTGSSR
jgi:hypothetical protein